VQRSLHGGAISFADRKITGEVLLFTDFIFGITMADGILTGNSSLSTHVSCGIPTDVDILHISSTESVEDVPVIKGISVGISMGDDPLSTDFKGRILGDEVS
jgi:hypothetical protein